MQKEVGTGKLGADFQQVSPEILIKAPQAQYPAIAIICLYIKFIIVKMSGKKMMEGQITILNQILIISMHIASLIKRPCYLLIIIQE